MEKIKVLDIESTRDISKEGSNRLSKRLGENNPLAALGKEKPLILSPLITLQREVNLDPK